MPAAGQGPRSTCTGRVTGCLGWEARRSHQSPRLCEARPWGSATRSEVGDRKRGAALPAPRSQTSGPQDGDTVHLCCFGRLVRGDVTRAATGPWAAMSKKEADADSVGAAGPRAPGSPDVTSPKPLSEGGARSQWRDVCHNRKKRRPGRGTWPLGTDGNRKTSRGAALPLPLPGLDDPRRFSFFPHPKRTRCTRSGLEGPEEGRKTPSPPLPGQ